MEYMGICDCHGMESFIPEEEADVFILKMRAIANRHRHALVYRVDVPEDTAKAIEMLLKHGKYKEALLLLKTLPEVGVMKEQGMEKSWRLIPNDDLDPFSY